MAGCGIYVPKLPRMAVMAEVWLAHAGGGGGHTRSMPDLAVHVTLPDLGQHEGETATVYIHYSAGHDRLRDEWDYNHLRWDAVVIRFPTATPRRVGWRVREVRPRWLGYPNEHLTATLVRLTAGELSVLASGGPPPGAPSLTLSRVLTDPAEAEAGAGVSTLVLLVVDGAGTPVPGVSYSISGTGSSVVETPQGETDPEGRGSSIVTDPVVETVTYSVELPEIGDLVETGTVTWTDGPPPPHDYLLDVVGVLPAAGSSCDDCPVYDRSGPDAYHLPWRPDLPGEFDNPSAAYLAPCHPLGVPLVWYTYRDYTAHVLRVRGTGAEAGVPVTIVAYAADTLGWNGSDSLVLLKVPGSDAGFPCEFPETALLRSVVF